MSIDPASVRLLRDKVLLRRVAYEHPVLVVVGIKLNRGEVVAIGPGKRKRRLVHYARAPGSLTDGVRLEDGPERVGADGAPLLHVMRVKVGEVVEFSPVKHDREFEYGGEQYVIISEGSIYGIDRSGSNSAAILSQRSAGWEKGRNGAKDTFLAR